MPRSGSATSSPKGSSRPATLTSAASPTCAPPTSTATPNATSSPASADGPSPSTLPAGQQISLFGPDHAPANHSVQPARARRPMTNAICGLAGFLSSRSGALQSSLENRLRQRLAGAGSTLFSLIWRRKGTPAGRPYYQLVASALRTFDSEFGSWPSPQARDGAHGRSGQPERTGGRRRNLDDYATLAGWSTPNAEGDARCASPGFQKARERHAAKGVNKQIGLRDQVRLASWPTPNTSDALGANPPDRQARRKASAPKRTSGGPPGFGNLRDVAQLTPDGHTSSGSPAQTEKPGQLSPDFSRWLMGYSAAHLSCAPSETPSSRRSRPSSSPPTGSVSLDR